METIKGGVILELAMDGVDQISKHNGRCRLHVQLIELVLKSVGGINKEINFSSLGE